MQGVLQLIIPTGNELFNLIQLGKHACLSLPKPSTCTSNQRYHPQIWWVNLLFSSDQSFNYILQQYFCIKKVTSFKHTYKKSSVWNTQFGKFLTWSQPISRNLAGHQKYWSQVPAAHGPQILCRWQDPWALYCHLLLLCPVPKYWMCGAHSSQQDCNRSSGYIPPCTRKLWPKSTETSANCLCSCSSKSRNQTEGHGVPAPNCRHWQSLSSLRFAPVYVSKDRERKFLGENSQFLN